MPVTTIPLAGAYSTRPGVTFLTAAKDSRFIACYMDAVVDSATQQMTPYLVKRAAFSTHSTIVAAKTSAAISVSDSGRFCIAMGSDGTVYFKSNSASTAVNVGSMATAVPMYITPAYINNETYFLLSDNGSNGCYYLADSAATVVTPTFTANTNSNTTLSNVSSFTGLFVGQALSGTDIAAGARIASMNTGSSTITMTDAATGTTVGVTVTFSRLAKIIDTDFPSGVAGAFAFMDGFCFIMSSDGKIYNSDINNPASWQASNYIKGVQTTSLAGGGQGCAKIKDRIVGFYSGSYEYYYNAGNSFGSPLTRISSQSSNIGIFDYCQYGDYLFAIGSADAEQICNAFLFSVEGGKEVTTPTVSRDLSQGISAGTNTVTGGRMGGHDCFIVQGIGTSLSMMYVADEDKWYETAFAADYFLSGAPNAGGLYAISTGDSILYQVSSTTFQDGGVAFSMIVQTQPYALNQGLPFIIDNINLLADTQSSGSTLLESSADDYATFGTIGSFALTSQQKNLPCGGYYDTSVAFRISDSGNNPWRGQALQITWRPA